MTDWAPTSPSPVVVVDGSESEEDPEIVVSPNAASSAAMTSPAATTQSSLPSVLSSASSSPPSSPSAAQSPLSSPTGAAVPPSSRRAQSSGSGNGYVSAQQKRANMDLTGLGSNPRTPPPASDGAASKPLPQSSSGSFLSSFTKKLSLNTASTAGNSTANTASSPTALRSPPQAAASTSKASGANTAASPPTDRLSGSSSASLSLSPPPTAASAAGTSSASSSTAVSSTAAPLSPSSASSLPSSSSFGASGGATSSKFSLTSFFGSITARDGSGSVSGGSNTTGGALSQTEQQKDQQKREWLSLLPPLSATGVAASSPPSQSFSNPKVKARCVKLAWFGIPSSVRGDAWQWIIGNSLNITEDLFWIMSGRAQEVKENKMRRMEREEAEREAALQRTEGSQSSAGNSNGVGSSSDAPGHKANLSREESVSLIDTDVSRTFPELKFFHDGGPLQAPLYQVLESFGCYRPDVGYVQGMSHIASMLLLNMEPLPAFIAVCNLLNQEMYFKFFRMNAQQMKLHLDVFQQVFKGHHTTHTGTRQAE